MTENPIFKGAATALITPTNAEGVDYDKLRRLIDWQIEEGIDGLVICGTSGESSTLTDAEHKKVIAYSIECVDGRVPVIAGTGSNETDYALELSRFSSSAGADGVLVVTPYYNKATQNGLVKMYYEIADASTVPLVVYNVPSRTGVSIEPATYARLAEHENIRAIKEANGNISKIVETMSLVGDKLDLYSGNDDQVIPLMSMGGLGVISVLSNIMPKQTSLMCKKFLEGDIAGAAKMQADYMPIIKALFCEVNPIPAKAAMAAMGWCENYLRLPLTKMEPAHEKILLAEMRKLGLLEQE